MILSLRVKGGDRVAANLRDLNKRFPEYARKALLEEAEIDKREAVKRTPIDTGALRDSAQVVGEERGTFRKDLVDTMVSITFGNDEDVYYAVYVHEDPDAFHPYGEYKFLEKTLRESAPFMSERVGARLRSLLARHKVPWQ